ncbi:MAG: dienelactone hydrolase family protein [Lentisphaeria bacterium]|nr:dienelactone hydrolase family protein [Lentisphaeria bacterium]
MITIEERKLAGVPCLLIGDDQPGDRPLIIHLHGWSGAKPNPDALPDFLMQWQSNGFTILCLDAYEHGERRTENAFRAIFNGWAFICDAMDKTAKEIPALLDAALAVPGISQVNPQLMGISMGGVIAQQAMAHEKRFTSMVSVIGRSSFYQADDWCREAQKGTWCDDWCEANAPLLHPERYSDRPLLFLDGGQDTDCPAAINKETVDKINALGGQASQFVDDAVGHAFSESMKAECLQWLKKHS